MEKMTYYQIEKILSVKALRIYVYTDPVTIYRYKDGRKILYAVRGCIDIDGLTKKDLNSLLLELGK